MADQGASDPADAGAADNSPTAVRRRLVEQLLASAQRPPGESRRATLPVQTGGADSDAAQPVPSSPVPADRGHRSRGHSADFRAPPATGGKVG
jgi:hypothetical protein